MNITNKYCLLSALTQEQIDKLVELMPKSGWFNFISVETLIGFSEYGTVGTFKEDAGDDIIAYKEMLSLLGVKEEEKLIPHVHQKEIIAWANGEEVEYKYKMSSTPIWHRSLNPKWILTTTYRVKPKLTPTQLRIKKLTEELMGLEAQYNVECGIKKVMGS
tara:strand:- start:11 stop:493 length:483 start_codon:yes stop_codon:yes gene_type:complete